jgi:hypothetical protein
MSHIEFVDDILVYNSVSAVSGLFADTVEVRSGISSPDLNQLKAASANWDSVYLTVSANSAAWDIDYDGADIKALTANWENTYIINSGLSADWTTAFNTVCAWGSSSVPDIALRFTADVLGNGIDNTYTYFHGLGTKDLVVSVIEIATGNIALAAVYVTDTEITVEFAAPVTGTLYRLVAIGATNFADIFGNYQYLSANWQNTYTTVSDNSAEWDTTYTNLYANSANWDSLYALVSTNSANWDSIYTNVSSNSGNWESSYSILCSTSANWDSLYANVSSNSGNWDSNYTILSTHSAEWDTTYTTVSVNSSNWQNTYTTVSSNSSDWSYQGIDIKALTGNWQNTYTTVSSNSSDWSYNGSDLKALSSNWQNTYTTVSSNSSSWSYQGIDIKSLTANWQNTYTTFKNASGTFLTSETDSQTLSFDETSNGLSILNGNTVSLSSIENNLRGLYVPLSGGTMTGKLNLPTATTSYAPLNIGSSPVQPTNPLSGDVWMRNNLIQYRGSSATVNSVVATAEPNVFTARQTIQTSDNTNAALRVTQLGTGDSIRVEDETNPDATAFIVDNLGNVMLGLSSVLPGGPKITVNGSISSNNVIYASGGNSDIWNSSYTTVSANSSSWSYQGTDIKALTGNWQNTYSNVSTNSSSWGANPQVVEATVFNADTVTMTRGNVVYSFGATGDTMSVKLASNNDEATSSKTLGFVNDNIAPGSTGTVTIVGRMENLNFGSPYVNGDALWLGSTPGTYTRTKPTAPNHGVYLGVVERANSGNGIAYVKVQNGYELYEIHDVSITTPLPGQMLRRNSANTLWTNTDDGTKWDNTYSTVNTNSASNWDNNLIRTYTHTNFLPISGGTITGNLSVTGDITYIDTNIAVTSAVAIDTSSTEAALRITQRGSGDVLRVEDSSNIDSTPFIINSDGLVGVGTNTPNQQLTVVGSISSNANIYANNISLKDLTFTGDLSTNVTSITATDIYLKVLLNNQPKYIRLFDVE